MPTLDLTLASDRGASASDDVTADDTPTLTGMAEAGATVEVFDGATSLGTTLATAAGIWSLTTAALADGVHSFTARASDAAGNTSSASTALAVTIDTLAPAAPSIDLTAASDSGATDSDNITADPAPILTGTAEADATVEVFDGASSLGTTPATAAGTWSFTTPGLADGLHSFTARATDTAGNSSPAGAALDVIIDTLAPAAPTIDLTAASDSGASNSDNITADTTPTLSGTALAGTIVEVFDGGASLGTTVATAAGTWSLTTALLADGVHSFTSRSTDAAGNASPASAALAVTIATAAPAPSIDAITEDLGTAIQGDGITTDNDLLVSGTAAQGATVEVFLDGASLGTTPADGTGAWSLQSGVIAVGAHTLTAAATDTSGNTSPLSAGFAIEILALPQPPASFSDLDGANGFTLNGVDVVDLSGFSVSSVGDVNADGFIDLIVGAHLADPNGNSAAGESYVVFGASTGFAASLDLSSLNGANGFLLQGVDANDRSGRSVSSAGDVNGDGITDLIIGADIAGPNGPSSGESYVVFGTSAGFAASLDLSNLNGSNGFVLNGISATDRSGFSVSSAGDVNGDGLADLIIGAQFGDPNLIFNAGESYVVFGSTSPFAASLELSNLDGSNGFVLNGISASDRSGYSVSSAGDVNGDGFADIVIGALYASPNGNGSAGQTYVVFGASAGFASSFELSSLDGSNGFILNGTDPLDFSGTSVSSAGDFNGDGFADLIIGADGADPNGLPRAGEGYVVFGAAGGFAASLDLSSLDGSNGFALIGIDPLDFSGTSVSSAGDVNGDGFDDLIIGANRADPNGIVEAGESYVIFGSSGGFAPSLNLSSLDGANGFVIQGLDVNDYSGYSVSSGGDVNGDGFADLIIGAFGGDPNGNSAAGESYVVFGGNFTGSLTQLGTATAETLTGTPAAERLVGAQGNDILVGGGGADVLLGAQGDDILAISDATILKIDGGSGNDTLRLDGGFALDLTLIADSRMIGLEGIDLGAGGPADASTLTLDLREVLNISDTSNRLLVTGDASDIVQVGSFTDSGADITIGLVTFDVFTDAANSQAELLIQQGLTTV